MNPEVPSPDDETLARQTQAGSLPAFEELVYRYEARVYRFVTQCGSFGPDARDVTQDTFVRAFRAIGQFDADRSFASWLFTIARRQCVDRYRSAPPILQEPTSDLVSPEDPASSLARREAEQNLWSLARRCLPEIQFQALWLSYAEDMSVAEIAEVLGKARTHVKVLLFRARKSLGIAFEKAQRVPIETSKSADSYAPVLRDSRSGSLNLNEVSLAGNATPRT